MLKKIFNLLVGFGRKNIDTNCIGLLYQPEKPEELK